ncbi:hypothetical protein NDI37_14555 [Funiculus sociatus GB2-A5]|uniref:Uncharacterized protein n=1 Tax=Funiculus sociatus GB2-A5 TaxID=2933946 RepID=A0ABV0JQM2_9CYAN|nr:MULTISPECIES: hypothetical protein [unclassified Trichocoleus]MBD1905392.1 hypothetical protein [Trichocoleus sp. FACHB-832]MBD2061888.1 hypothetical protein [Trichocoleus sp. FACHB-6]
MKNLYIFVTSNRPDQYLNSSVHCILNEGVNRIVFVKITFSDSDVSLNMLRQNVINLLDNLSKVIYKFYTGDRAGETEDLNKIYQQTELIIMKTKYEQCLLDHISWETKIINYTEIKSYIASCKKQFKNSIFDVSGISKTFLGDIFACCLVEDIQNLYTFELKIKEDYTHPWIMLIHALQKDKQYNYVN